MTVPVSVQVMAAEDGTGDLSDQQIAQQIAELNQDYAGDESHRDAADTGFRFALAGADRYVADQWHRDKAPSSTAARPGSVDPTR